MATRSCQLRLQRTDLLHYVGRQVRDSALREDIVQEAYVRLLTFEAKPGAVVSDAPALLRRISLNLVRDYFRRRGRVLITELSDTIPCAQPTADQQLEHKQLIQLVARALSAMPRLRREVFVRRRMHGQSASEVAQALGLSRGAVSNHVVRAVFDLDAAIERFEKRDAPVRA